MRIRMIAGLALLLALIGYFGWRPVVDHALRLSPSWLLLAAVLILGATLLSAVNRFLLINIDRQISFRDFLPVYWVSWAAGLLVPGQVGDVAAMSALMRRHGMQVHQSLGRSLLDKLISFLVVGIFGLIGFTSHLSRIEYRALVLPDWFLGVLLACGLSGAIALAVPAARQRLARIAAGMKRLTADAARESWRTARQHPARVVANSCLSLASFALLGLSYWSIFRALGYHDTSIAGVIPAVAACSLIAYIPVSFNGIGTAEASGVVLFGQLGIAGPAVISAFICLRLVVFLLAWLPAGIVLSRASRDASSIR